MLHATNLRIPIVEVEGGTLTALAGFDGHQGVALAVAPRRWASTADILARAIERGEPPFVLVLDSLEDPQNVGTLMRSAEAAGIHGVIFPTRRQAPLTPAAVKASAGAVEHLLLCPVDDLPGALAELHARGLRVAGAEAGASLTVRETDMRGPLAIVVGSEGQGLGPAVRRRCDVLMRIPMRGRVGSLNAAVAGSVMLFEALSQRDVASPPVSLGISQPTQGGEAAEPLEPSAVAQGEQPAERAATPPSAEPTDPPAPAVRRRAPVGHKRKVVTATAEAPEATPSVADEGDAARLPGAAGVLPGDAAASAPSNADPADSVDPPDSVDPANPKGAIRARRPARTRPTGRA